MRIRLFSACVLSAWLAMTALAQTPPGTPPSLVAPPAPFPTPNDPPSASQPPAVKIEAQERLTFLPVPVRKTGLMTQAPAGPPAAPPVAPPVAPPADGPTTPAPPVAAAPPGPPPVADPFIGPPPLEPIPAGMSGHGVNPVWPTVPVPGSPGPRPGRFWMDNEALLWWIQGTRLPPLVTNSPPGVATATAGAPAVGAVSIYGPGSQANNLRLGYRLTLGGYLDEDRRFALEANFFMTANGGNQFNAQSPGDPILARPVINSVTGVFGAEPIAVPGVANGSIHIADRTTGVLGAGIWLRENFMRSDDPCDTCRPCIGSCGAGCCGGNCPASKCYTRFDSLIGYRYMRLSDNLEIDDLVNAVTTLNNLPAGSTLQRSDQFHASNTFHGVDLGATGEIIRGPWTVLATAKVAVGFNDSSIDVFGMHRLDGIAGPGGLLAQPTNIGHRSRVLASAIPELDLKLGYSFSPTVRVFVGYSFLYWYHVARATDQVDLHVSPDFLTRGGPTGVVPTAPSPLYVDRSIWMQGLSLGFEWRY